MTKPYRYRFHIVKNEHLTFRNELFDGITYGVHKRREVTAVLGE